MAFHELNICNEIKSKFQFQNLSLLSNLITFQLQKQTQGQFITKNKTFSSYILELISSSSDNISCRIFYELHLLHQPLQYSFKPIR